MVESKSKMSIRRQCKLLGVNRNRLNTPALTESVENLAIMRILDERYLNKPSHGILRMQDYLKDEGYLVTDS